MSFLCKMKLNNDDRQRIYRDPAKEATAGRAPLDQNHANAGNAPTAG
jgi:hypothetical protein